MVEQNEYKFNVIEKSIIEKLELYENKYTKLITSTELEFETKIENSEKNLKDIINNSSQK